MGKEINEQTCCLCLAEDGTFNLNTAINSKSLPLHEMVSFCLGIQVGKNSLSQLVCNECVLNVSNFQTFKRKILNAQDMLSSLQGEHDDRFYVPESAEYTEVYENGSETFNVIEMEEEHIEDENYALHEIITEHGNEVSEAHQRLPAERNKAKQNDSPNKQGGNQNKRPADTSANRLANKRMKVEQNQGEKITLQTNECLICPAVLDDILQLNDHIVQHTIIKCKACNRSFARYSNLKRHFNVVHSKPKPFVCDICGLGFSFSVNLQAHASLHYSGKIRMK